MSGILPSAARSMVRANAEGVIQASMPAAVNTTILAAEYQLDSSLVTAIVFIGTMLSPLTLTPLLVLLGRWA